MTSDVDSKDVQDLKINHKNKGQFEEGSNRAKEMGRLGGQKSSKKQKVRSQTSYVIMERDIND